MIDLFGLSKKQDPQERSEPAAEAPPPARGSHKLWAFLLVLDAVFVIVFAGAVAAKVYQYWNAAANPIVAVPRRRPVKEPAKMADAPAASTASAPAPAAPEPAPVTAPAPKAPEPVAPASAKTAADAPRPPKPSLLVDAPKHRTLPKPADATGRSSATPAPAAPAAEGKVKALRVDFKIHAPKAQAVHLVGAFIVRGGRKEMIRQDDGTWTAALYLNPGQYRYFFSVDKKKQLDPENPHTEKGASLISVP